MEKNVTIMGIDPGLASTGVGVIMIGQAGRYSTLAWDSILTRPSQNLPNRLQLIHDLIQEKIEEWKPNAIAIEQVFFAKNVQSAVLMAHGRGAAILAASKLNVPIFEYSALQVKQAVVGKGRASKNQVSSMVSAILNLKPPPKSDHETDALAIALCHSFAIQRTVKVHQESSNPEENIAQQNRKTLLAEAMKRKSGKSRKWKLS